MAKSVVRRQQRTRLIQQLRDQVRLLEEGIRRLDTGNCHKHRERAKDAAEQDANVLELFDRKSEGFSCKKSVTAFKQDHEVSPALSMDSESFLLFLCAGGCERACSSRSRWARDCSSQRFERR